jgi:hypothetical protein
MATQRLIALNINTGAFVNILATLNTSRMLMCEDDAATRQGFVEQDPLDNFSTSNTHGIAANILAEPIAIPDINVGYDHFQKLLGLPAQNSSGAFNFRAADKLLSARSASGTATTLRFSEYE